MVLKAPLDSNFVLLPASDQHAYLSLHSPPLPHTRWSRSEAEGAGLEARGASFGPALASAAICGKGERSYGGEREAAVREDRWAEFPGGGGRKTCRDI